MGYSIYERIATTFLVAGFELEWLAISHYFCVNKNTKGVWGYSPSSRYIQNEVARIYDACQTT